MLYHTLILPYLEYCNIVWGYLFTLFTYSFIINKYLYFFTLYLFFIYLCYLFTLFTLFIYSSYFKSKKGCKSYYIL